MRRRRRSTSGSKRSSETMRLAAGRANAPEPPPAPPPPPTKPPTAGQLPKHPPPPPLTPSPPPPPQRAAKGAPQHGGAHRAADLGAGPGSEVRRHHVDKDRRGHHDRPQAHAGGLHGSVEPRGALVLAVAGELDDEDGVLAGQADQHHE